MTPAVSLVIVSLKRPIDLERVLASLAFQTLENFEIIVVADRPPLILKHLRAPVHYIEMVEGNISRARNMGVEAARAPIIAFCDDDAIPDPPWLARLVQPFYDCPDIAGVGGYVRGRNGFSFQWRNVGFLENGEDIQLSSELDFEDRDGVLCFPPQSGKYLKLIGTNCAFRKHVLEEIGGFDQGFFYYLDDTDLCKRLQDAGHAVALAPHAQIVHNFRPSRGRSEDRVPQSLYNLGASTHLFLRKHCPDEIEANLQKLREDQEKRLYQFFDRGLLMPRTIRKLMRDLENGIVAGKNRSSICPFAPATASPPVPLETRKVLLQLTLFRLKVENADRAIVRVRITPSSFAARMHFSRKGYWLITVGVMGRIERKGSLIRVQRPSTIYKKLQAWISARFSDIS